VVTKVWGTKVHGGTAVERWQNKVRLSRKKVKGWSVNVESELRKQKDRLSAEYSRLDIMAEAGDLTNQERERLTQINCELNKVWSMEETKATQRVREREIKGDRNTKYFHIVANQRRRKTTMLSLDDHEGTVQSTEEIIKVATKYYKDLLKFEPRPNISIDDNFFNEGERVIAEENAGLEVVFTEEVKIVIFGSYSDGAPGPDSLTFSFHQIFWDLIKQDLMAMFSDLYEDKLDIYTLNFAQIITIPKEKNARTMYKFTTRRQDRI
jgi:hypothetical protein